MRSDTLSKVREFTRRELIGNEEQLDALAEAPLPLFETFRETGLSNWWLPKSSGGLGLGLEESVDIVAELAYGDAGAAFTLFAPILATTMVSLYGSSDLEERYLKPLATSGGFCATLGGEHAAGSELLRIATTATRAGSDLVLNGEKAFSTNTGFSDFLVVIARSGDNPSDFLAVVVPRDNPGVRIVKRWETIGLRSSAVYEVRLEECQVPADNALRGHGLRLLEVALNATRTLIAATALGISRRIRDTCLDYARTKSVRKAPLIDNPVFAGKLGQAEMLIDVMWNQCRTAARDFDAVWQSPNAAAAFLRLGTLKTALTAKLFCGQSGWQIASMGSESFGGLGYTTEMVVGKLLRDIRHVSIVEGGDDVVRELLFGRYVVPASKRS